MTIKGRCSPVWALRGIRVEVGVTGTVGVVARFLGQVEEEGGEGDRGLVEGGRHGTKLL